MADEKKNEKPATEKADEAGKPVEEKASGPALVPNTFRTILGEKVGMTQLFTDGGECHAVTAVKVGPCHIMRLKTPDGPDKYSAVVLAYGNRSDKNLNGPDAGQFKKAGIKPAQSVREIRVPDTKEFAAGQMLSLEGRFAAGDYVDVQGTSKGKGFAGVMKRHNFGGLPASHGASDKERSPGSIASRRSLGRVLPGQRMAGHMGHETVTVQKVEVISVDTDKNMIYLGGSVPGPKGSMVTVSETVKAMKKRVVKQKAKGPKKDKMGNIVK